MAETKTYGEGKVAYLQMIQEPISRMSTISALLKSFAATTVTSIAAISYVTTETIVLALLLLPLSSFAILDVYYLQLERKFRYLYNQVREGKHEVDYSLALIFNEEEIEMAKASFRMCFRSPAISYFYTPLYTTLLIVIVLDYLGVI